MVYLHHIITSYLKMSVISDCLLFHIFDYFSRHAADHCVFRDIF